MQHGRTSFYICSKNFHHLQFLSVHCVKNRIACSGELCGIHHSSQKQQSAIGILSMVCSCSNKYCTHSTLRPPFLLIRFSYKKYGGAYNWIIVISLPFPRCGAREGNSNDRIICHRLVRLAMKLVVAQFWRAKENEIINEGAECELSENAMLFSHHHKLATSLPPHQSLGQWSISFRYRKFM